MKKLILLVTALSSFVAIAGSADGAGGDIKGPDFGTAWFLGKEKITICIKGDLPLDRGRINEEVTAAFATWKKYFEEKGLLMPQYMNFYGVTGEEPPFATDPDIHETCDGKERLTFHFGESKDPQVIKAKALYKNPIAFAERLEVGTNGMGRGIIWIKTEDSPDWSKAHTLRGILLHELGHVYGVDHVPGTIMSDDIVKNLTWYTTKMTADEASTMLTKIDQELELVRCQNCVTELKGKLQIPVMVREGGPKVVDATDYQRRRRIEVFKLLTGRDPEGEISVRMEQKDYFTSTYYIKDGKKAEETFSLSLVETNHVNDVKVLRVRVPALKFGDGGYSAHYGVVGVGVLKSTKPGNQKEHLVHYARNVRNRLDLKVMIAPTDWVPIF